MRRKKLLMLSGDKIMKLYKTLLVSCGLSLVLVSPVLAKHAKISPSEATDQTQQSAQSEISVPVVDMAGKALADAIELCQLVAEDKRAIIDALEVGGWTSEIDYNAGNAPFYKEISADQTYAGVGEVEIWGFVEDYPGYKMGYCSFTIDSPDVVFDLSPINEIDGLVGELQTEGEQSYGMWRNVVEPGAAATTFIHAYQNADTFLYQITVIQNLDN